MSIDTSMFIADNGAPMVCTCIYNISTNYMLYGPNPPFLVPPCLTRFLCLVPFKEMTSLVSGSALPERLATDLSPVGFTVIVYVLSDMYNYTHTEHILQIPFCVT